MLVHFWGVRGSIASPGPGTARVGGNTSAVEVRSGSTTLLLDAGTGLRRFGDAFLGRADRPEEVTVLLSHYHWDHIQGLPFFAPAYVAGTRLTVVGGPNGVMSVKHALAHQMQPPVFPVGLDELGADLATKDVRPGQIFDVGELRVTVAKLNHPGGVMAYRIDGPDGSLVYATDTEHHACVDPVLKRLAEGADLLVYDAQYTPEEYEGRGGRSRVGWGHSTYVAATEVAAAAGVGELALFHHDPERRDEDVFRIEGLARALFPRTRAAVEGLELRVGRAPGSRAA